MATATSIPTTLANIGLPPEPVRRLTVSQYQDLVQIGSITTEDRCELLEGWLIPKMTKGPEHEVVVEILRDILSASLPMPWVCRSQGPLVLVDGVPEPDVAIVSGPQSRYRRQHPSPFDAALVIEVSDSTLERDRGTKLRSYARSNVQHLWIVNLIDRQIEVYQSPQPQLDPPRYGNVTSYRAGESVPVLVEGNVVLSIAVDALLSSD